MSTDSSKQWEVRRHWNDFLTTSSVRGLKRTRTSETRCLRLFWVFFLLASLALMGLQIHQVMHTYLVQKDSTAMQSKRLNFPVPFPAVSLCRESPYNSPAEVTRAMQRHGAPVTTPKSYSRKIADLLYRLTMASTSSGNMSQADIELALGVIFTFDTAVAYQAQVPRAAINDVALPMTRRLVAARGNFVNGSTVTLAYNAAVLSEAAGIELPAAGSGSQLHVQYARHSIEAKSFYHWQYFVCQTLQLNISEADQDDLSSLDLLLWHPSLKFVTEDNATDDRAFPVRGFWSGDAVRLALHPAGEHGKVHVDYGGSLVQNGGFTEVRFAPRVTKYLHCARHPMLHGDHGQYDYNLNDCKYLAYDLELRRSCNCTLDPLAWNKSQCLRINWENLGASDWGRCMGDVEWIMEICDRPACTETEFQYESSFAPWGINDFQWKWITDLLVDPAVSLPQYLALSQMGDAASTAAINRPTLSFSELKDSLTSLRISRQSGMSVYQQEVQLTSLANMFSSCGGAMSLFMGITVTLLAEFIEFVYHVCRRGRPRTRHPVQPPPDPPDSDRKIDDLELKDVSSETGKP